MVAWPDAVSCMNGLSSASLTHWASHCRIMITLTFWWLRLCLLRRYEPLESARGQDAVKSTFVFEPERPSRIRIAQLATAPLALSLVMVVVAFRLLRLRAKHHTRYEETNQRIYCNLRPGAPL